jgi:hypothetical protein
VWLPALKARIFDYIDQYPGVTAAGIAFHFYEDETKINRVRQNIFQINELLAATDIRISGTGKDMKGCYRIIR